LARVMTYRLPRMEIASGFPLTWKVYIGEETERCSPLRVRLKVWNWTYRRRSAGSPTFTGDPVPDHTHTQAATGAGGGHDHAAVETDGVDAVPGAHQTLRTYPGSGVNSSLLAGVATAGQAAATIRTDSVADHTHTNPDTGAAGAHTPTGSVSSPPAAIAEEALTAGFLTIRIDGADYKTGIGTTTDGDKIVDELITERMPPGERVIVFEATALGAVEAVLIVEY